VEIYSLLNLRDRGGRYIFSVPERKVWRYQRGNQKT